ncbi:hypothetical protein FJT64_023604 [Amphibalanus amphitrite]|uniref:Uncharacterized protein n=1 Tax=Amphibalanus amphitrite TaxID=1232801 RepID=A0A6A4WD84_AMPAM|nr:hypothetical protein FJT64_023604 [Amphibalanus amphitrite]
MQYSMPWVQGDRVSYAPQSDVRDSTIQRMEVAFSVSRLRRTMFTVIAFGMEDLLAYMGGYLGLLMGSSILSMLLEGNTMIRRLMAKWFGRNVSKPTAENDMHNGSEVFGYPTDTTVDFLTSED